MAVKFRTPAGATDLLGQTSPRFPVRDPEAFVQLTEASAKPYLIPLFLARHPSAAPAVLANLRSKTLAAPYSFAEVSYYPIHAYGWLAADGARSWVRYVLAPLATRDDRLAVKFEGRDRLVEEMAARLDRGPVRFDLRVTVAGDGDDPHDPMSVWKGVREFSAGIVDVTSTAPDPEADGGGPVVFDPVRVVDGITLSEDPILLYRPHAYSTSVSRRSSSSVTSSLVKTLVIGTGGREHALARALSLDPGVTEVHAAPGNPGMAAVATLHEVDPMSGRRWPTSPSGSVSTWSSSDRRRRWWPGSPTR